MLSFNVLKVLVECGDLVVVVVVEVAEALISTPISVFVFNSLSPIPILLLPLIPPPLLLTLLLLLA